MNAKQKVIIADSSAIICNGLREMLSQSAIFDVIGTATDAVHLDRLLCSRQPDIIIVNPQMLDLRKRTCVERLQADASCNCVLAMVYQFVDPDVLKLFAGSINITDDEEHIIKRLQQCSQSPETEHIDASDLTEREREILVAVAKGMTNKEIADKYNISVHTAISHRKNIVRKTGIRSVSGLTVYAILNNMIDMNEIE